MVPILLGPGWNDVAWLGTLTAFWSGAIAPTMVVAGSLEFSGAQRSVRGPVWACVAVTALGAASALALTALWPLFVGMFVALGLRHLLHVRAASTLGLLDGRRLIYGYVRVLISAALLWFTLSSLVLAAKALGVPPFLLIATLMTTLSLLIWALRRRLPPYRILREYGVL
jgi:hypothetical protein